VHALVETLVELTFTVTMTILVKRRSLSADNAIRTLPTLDVLCTVSVVPVVSVLPLNLRILVTLVPILWNANGLLTALERAESVLLPYLTQCAPMILIALT